MCHIIGQTRLDRADWYRMERWNENDELNQNKCKLNEPLIFTINELTGNSW